MALSLSGAAAAVLAEAHLRTDLADAQRPADCRYGPTDRLLTPGRVRALERDGLVVVPGALTAAGLRRARADIAGGAASAAFFGPSGVGGGGASSGERGRGPGGGERERPVRQDLVCWLRPNANAGTDTDKTQETEEGGNDDNGPHLQHCIDLVRGVAAALSANRYADSTDHRVPRQCQLALYRGDGAAGYDRHLDRCRATLAELGLLEYLRLEDYRGRAVTVILYLNDESRTKEDGGQLRCWLRKRKRRRKGRTEPPQLAEGEREREDDDDEFGPPFDIEPTGGSMLIFNSDRLEHQVLASLEDRYALTVWINGSMCDAD